MNTLFQTQWLMTKNLLLEGKDLRFNQDGSENLNKLHIMEMLFDTCRDLTMKKMLISENVNLATMNKFILPVMRYIFPTLIANEIIGVQVLKDVKGDIINNKDETISIEAKSRKLAARWTFEAAYDGDRSKLKDENGNKLLDIEEEMMAALAQEVVAEIDQEHIYFLKKVAKKRTFETVDLVELKWDHNKASSLLVSLMDIEMNRIETALGKPHEGKGFWCIVSPTTLTILQASTTSAFARTIEGVFKAPTNIKFVGILNKTTKVYVNPYAADSSPVLIGYKESETDAAAIYSPYDILHFSDVIIDPQTFEPVVGFDTKGNLYEQENIADYLGMVGIDTGCRPSF